jgi:flagellar protein FliO/FliZ
MIDPNDLIRPVGALLLVIGLIVLVGWIQRRLEARRLGPGARRSRLEVLAQRPLDQRHRVVLLRCDRQEHLVVVGPSGCTPLAMPGSAGARPLRGPATAAGEESVAEIIPPPREPP